MANHEARDEAIGFETLLEQIADGHKDALKQLYDSTQARIQGVVHAFLGDSSEVEDVVVEVYVQVWSQAGTFDPDRSRALTWLSTIARHRAIDHRRRSGRRAGETLESLDSRALRSPRPGPQDDSVRSEAADHVHEALLKLPQEERRAITAAYFGGLTHREVARALEQPLGTIKSRIRNGLARLRRSLNLHGEETSR